MIDSKNVSRAKFRSAAVEHFGKDGSPLDGMQSQNIAHSFYQFDFLLLKALILTDPLAILIVALSACRILKDQRGPDPSMPAISLRYPLIHWPSGDLKGITFDPISKSSPSIF